MEMEYDKHYEMDIEEGSRFISEMRENITHSEMAQIKRDQIYIRETTRQKKIQKSTKFNNKKTLISQFSDNLSSERIIKKKSSIKARNTKASKTLVN